MYSLACSQGSSLLPLHRYPTLNRHKLGFLELQEGCESEDSYWWVLLGIFVVASPTILRGGDKGVVALLNGADGCRAYVFNIELQ
jgi:hypothetical protein